MSFQCANCGSPSHRAYDCPKPKSATSSRPKPQNAVKRVLAPAPPVKNDDQERESPWPRIMRKPGFPFLRKCTLDDMARRILEATTPSKHFELPKRERPAVALPKREKASKQEALF